MATNKQGMRSIRLLYYSLNWHFAYKFFAINKTSGRVSVYRCFVVISWRLIREAWEVFSLERLRL